VRYFGRFRQQHECGSGRDRAARSDSNHDQPKDGISATRAGGPEEGNLCPDGRGGRGRRRRRGEKHQTEIGQRMEEIHTFLDILTDGLEGKG